MEPVIGIPIEVQKVLDQINEMQTALPKEYQVIYYLDANGDVDVKNTT